MKPFRHKDRAHEAPRQTRTAKGIIPYSSQKQNVSQMKPTTSETAQSAIVTKPMTANIIVINSNISAVPPDRLFQLVERSRDLVK